MLFSKGRRYGAHKKRVEMEAWRSRVKNKPTRGRERKEMAASQSHPVSSALKSLGKNINNGDDNHCHSDSSTATGTRINSSASASPSASKSTFAHLKEKFKAMTQMHSDKNGELQSEASKLPPKPSKSGKRNSLTNNPGPTLERSISKRTHGVIEKSSRSHSDRCGWIAQTAAKEKLLASFRGDSIRLGNSRLRFNPLEGLCCVGTEAESEDGQIEVSNASRKSKQINFSEHTERIMVYVRVRPLSKKEEAAGARSCVSAVNNKDLYFKEIVNENDYLRSKRTCSRTYTFDAVFPDSVEQQEVYNTSTAELVDEVLQGRNASVFCYGATGAGKTHTMLGTVETPGVMVMSIKDLFAKLERLNCYGEPMVFLSYLEIYNESVKDLLSSGRPLVLREDKQGNVSSGITHYKARSAKEVMDLLHRGNQNRTTESTRVNETSSRSHAILQVVLEYKAKEGLTTVSHMGKLSLVDLAGSERATATDQRTLRSVEGANINKSLLALSSCVNALVEGKRHIPYRDSKLTQLLKDSLGGACQTAMIANISPSNLSYSETQNTLHWADRAKEIRTKPACLANEGLEKPESQIEHAKLLLEMQKEIRQLRMQNDQLQQRLLAVENQTLASTPSGPCSSPMRDGRHHAKKLQFDGDGQISRHELSNNGHEEDSHSIEELRRNLQALKEDSVRVKTEKERQHTASLMSLKKKYRLQLKHKDGVIRKLCQMAHKIQSNDFVSTSADLSVIESLAPPKQPTVQTISTPQNNYEDPHSKSDKWERTGQKSPSPSPSGRLSLPASEKKMVFGDITNKPAAPKITSRIDTSDAPSMLLQPGFYRELSSK